MGLRVLARTETGRGAKWSFPVSRGVCLSLSVLSLSPLGIAPLQHPGFLAGPKKQGMAAWPQGAPRAPPPVSSSPCLHPHSTPTAFHFQPFITPGFTWCVYSSCVLSVSLLNHQLHETRTLSLLFTAGPPAFRRMPGVQLLFTEQ